MSEKKKSFFSNNSISTIITEIVEYLDELNKEIEGYRQIDKKLLANHLLNNKLINQTMFDMVINYKIENCHAIVQKKGKYRCSNPAKKNCNFCNFHINNPSDLTVDDYKN
jgi:hypothetical protein